MSSIEKKEIIQNGAFGVIGGLLMGGPMGAIAAGLAAAGFAHMQEINDQKKRDEYERIHISTEQREIKRKEIALEYERKKEATKDLKDLMTMDRPPKLTYKIFLDEAYNHYTEKEKYEYIKTYNRIIDEVYADYDQCYAEIDFDLLKNKISSGLRNRLDPDEKPYVIVKRYKNKEDLLTGRNLISLGNGVILKREDFRNKLIMDLNNPTIEKYKIISSRLVDCINHNTIRYMYTIDNGNNYYVCW